jgi:transposase-like protein
MSSDRTQPRICKYCQTNKIADQFYKNSRYLCKECRKKQKQKFATRLSSIIPTGFAGMTDEQREAVSLEYEDLLICNQFGIILNHFR